MPAVYQVDGFKIYSHLDPETTEKFLGEIRSKGLLPKAADIGRNASHYKMVFDGMSWSVAILHSENTIFIDRIVEERFDPRRV